MTFRERASTPNAQLSREIVRTFAQLPPVHGQSAKGSRVVSVVPPKPISADSALRQTVQSPAARLLESDPGDRTTMRSTAQNTVLNPNAGWSEASHFVVIAEEKIDRELRILAKNATNAAPVERISIFQEAAAELIAYLPSCAKLLTRIFHEYDSFIDLTKSAVTELKDHEAHWAAERKNLDGELRQLRSELKAVQSRDDARRQLVETSPLSELPSAQLVERIHDLEKRLTAERQQRSVLETKMSRTAAVSTEFHDTLRTLERNYQSIIAEKEDAISQVESECNRLRQQVADVQREGKEAISKLEDDLSGKQIVANTRDQHITLLLDRARHLESRVVVGVAKFAELQEAYNILEERLEKLNKPTTAVLPRDPAMTPRPNKSDIVNRVPSLGSAPQYTSTQAIIDALMETTITHAATVQKYEAAYKRVEKTVADGIGQVRIDIHRSLSNVLLHDESTMTD